MLAIDFETHLISDEQPAPKPVCVSWFDGKNKGLVKGMPEMLRYLTEALKHPLIVAHNMKFELSVIYEWFPELRQAVDKGLENEQFMCTRINETLINNTRAPRSARKDEGEEEDEAHTGKEALSDLVLACFKEDISETKTDPNAWRLRYAELEGVEEWPQDAVDYAINDSIWAYKLAEVQLMNLTGIDIFSPVSAEHYLTNRLS